MKLKNIIFGKSESERKITKSLNVYISDKHSEIIFAPIYREIKIPIYFEQDTCEAIDLQSTTEIIGEYLKRNFNKFVLNERKNINNKKTDWPAFKASKEKTIVGFEKNYKRFNIKGANEHNTILIIESILNNLIEIELTTTIAANSENSKLGQRLLKIHNCEICENRK